MMTEKHKYIVGDLVEHLETGIRMFVCMLTKDYDNTLLVNLSSDNYCALWPESMGGAGSMSEVASIGWKESELILVLPKCENIRRYRMKHKSPPHREV